MKTKYVYEDYFQAKLAMFQLWRPTGAFYPICAVCGRPCSRPPEAHHVFLSQRHKEAHNDLRNLAPIHNQMDAPCHQQQAHGSAKEDIANRLYLILGEGDSCKGWMIVADVWEKVWVPKLRLDIPDIIEGVKL